MVFLAIEVESYEYSDPILDFMRALFIRYDYDGARALIPLCEEVRFGFSFYSSAPCLTTFPGY
jgi:hypothetical protein